MLLTVFLIGLISGLVVLNISQGDEDIARLEARRFAALVEHLQDESTIAGVPMGVAVSTIDNRYDFWEFVDDWERVENVDVLREREVPSEITLDMILLQQGDEDEETDSDDGEAEAEESKAPSNLLLVEPTGLIRPFIASFTAGDTTFNVTIDNALNVEVSEEGAG